MHYQLSYQCHTVEHALISDRSALARVAAPPALVPDLAGVHQPQARLPVPTLQDLRLLACRIQRHDDGSRSAVALPLPSHKHGVREPLVRPPDKQGGPQRQLGQEGFRDRRRGKPRRVVGAHARVADAVADRGPGGLGGHGRARLGCDGAAAAPGLRLIASARRALVVARGSVGVAVLLTDTATALVRRTGAAVVAAPGGGVAVAALPLGAGTDLWLGRGIKLLVRHGVVALAVGSTAFLVVVGAGRAGAADRSLGLDSAVIEAGLFTGFRRTRRRCYLLAGAMSAIDLGVLGAFLGRARRMLLLRVPPPDVGPPVTPRGRRLRVAAPAAARDVGEQPGSVDVLRLPVAGARKVVAAAARRAISGAVSARRPGRLRRMQTQVLEDAGAGRAVAPEDARVDTVVPEDACDAVLVPSHVVRPAAVQDGVQAPHLSRLEGGGRTLRPTPSRLREMGVVVAGDGDAHCLKRDLHVTHKQNKVEARKGLE